MTRALRLVAATAVLFAGILGATAMPVAAAGDNYEEDSEEDFLDDILDLDDNDVDADADAEDNDLNVEDNDLLNDNNVVAETDDIASDNDVAISDSGNIVAEDTLDVDDLLSSEDGNEETEEGESLLGLGL
jgi:hypothetical protein